MATVNRGLIINHPYFKEAKQQLKLSYDSYGYEFEPRCVPILGPSGTGKSTIIREFVASIDIPNDGQSRPVVVVETPSNPTVKSMASEVLKSIGDPMYYRGTEVQMTDRIRRFLKALDTRLLIFDELQNLIDKESDKLSFKASDWLKRLINMAHIPVAIVGLERTQELFLVNEQLRRRFVEAYEIKPFDWSVPHGRKMLRSFLGTLQGYIRFSTDIDLASEKMALRMYYATGGLVGYIMKIVREAERYAQGEPITTELLAKSYSTVVNGSNRININPFISDDTAQLDRALAVIEESKPIRRMDKRK